MTTHPVPAVSDIGQIIDASPAAPWQRRIVRLLGIGCLFNFYEVALGSLVVTMLPHSWVDGSLPKAAFIGSAFAGEFLGAALLAGSADRFGRRTMFQVNLLAYALLSVLCALSPSMGVLVATRFLVGIGLGAELTLVDSYTTELMPSSQRGRRLAKVYLIGFCGVPVAAIAATLLPDPVLGIASWRILILGSALGAAFVWTLRRGLPESPRWLESTGRAHEALGVLAGLGLDTSAAALPAAGERFAAPDAAAHAVPDPRRRLLLACLLQGIGPLGFYGFASLAPLVLVHKGYDVVDSLAFTALTVLGYPIGATLLIPLAERLQRRTLVIVTTALSAPLGLAFGLATSTPLIVIAGFLTSTVSVVQATVTRSYVAELFTTRERAGRVGVTYSLSRLVAAVMPFAAVPLLDAAGPAPVYAGSAVLILGLAVATGILGPRANGTALA